MIEKNSMPRTLRHLHLGRNQIPDLNGTLRNMHELEWLFINANQLTTLDGQLPDDVNNLVLIHASDNYLQHLPQEFKNLHRIKTLFFEHNKLLGLDGALAKSKKLQLLVVSHNNIQTVSLHAIFYHYHIFIPCLYIYIIDTDCSIIDCRDFASRIS